MVYAKSNQKRSGLRPAPTADFLPGFGNAFTGRRPSRGRFGGVTLTKSGTLHSTTGYCRAWRWKLCMRDVLLSGCALLRRECSAVRKTQELLNSHSKSTQCAQNTLANTELAPALAAYSAVRCSHYQSYCIPNSRPLGLPMRKRCVFSKWNSKPAEKGAFWY